METVKIKMYIEAARQLMGNPNVAEKWLDNNSHKLTGKISSIKEAKNEILELV